MAAKTPPTCPRCGYNLTGIVASWTDSCPLQGVCSECGLTFDWCEVQNPELSIPGWFLENRFRDAGHTLGRSILRALAPGGFWNDVRLAFPIRTPRIFLFVFVIVLLAHGLLASASAFVKYQEFTRFGLGGAKWPEIIATLLWPYGSGYYLSMGPRVLPLVKGPGWAIVLAQALAPLAYFSLPQTFAQVKVRSAHLLRGWAYTLAPLAVTAALLAAHAALIETTRVGSWSLLAWLTWPPLMAIVYVVWACVHWYLFTRAYLRLPHAGTVTLAMLAIAGLLAILIQVILFWMTLDDRSWLM